MIQSELRLQMLMAAQVEQKGYDSTCGTICSLQKQVGITQSELSELTGIDVPSISLWQAGELRLEVPDLVKIWMALFQIRKVRRDSQDSKWIRNVRKELGLTQLEVARLSNLHERIVGHAESGSAHVPEVVVKRIVEALASEKDRRSAPKQNASSPSEGKQSAISFLRSD